MSKADSAYIRSLLIKRLIYYMDYVNINLYLTIDKVKTLKFRLCIDGNEIKGIFTDESLECFDNINYQSINTYLNSQGFENGPRNYLKQFNESYKYIKSELTKDRTAPINLQSLCIVLRASYDKSIKTLAFNAYREFKIDTTELRAVSQIFEKKFNNYNKTGLINITPLYK